MSNNQDTTSDETASKDIQAAINEKNEKHDEVKPADNPSAGEELTEEELAKVAGGVFVSLS